MGLIEKRIRVYLCDRCGESREVEGVEPRPAGWVPLLYGEDVPTVLACALSKTAELGKAAAPTWLCADCGSWHRKFLEGRKVAD